MKSVRYTFALKGLDTPSGTISFPELIDALTFLSESSQRALRLAVEGASKKTGPVPKWVAASSHFLLRGVKKGSTVLEFEAPTLHETAGVQIKQQDFWYTKPDPSDTAISILSKAVSDVTSGRSESERYDKGMLDSLLDFREFLQTKDSKIVLSEPKKHHPLLTFDSASLNTIQRVRTSFPDPRAMVVAGECDMVEKSTRKFKLIMNDGHVVMGRASGDRVAFHEMKSLFGTKVTVKGTMHYMANGKPRLLDADLIRSFEPGDGLFEELKATADLQAEIRKETTGARARNVVEDILGQWPGDEPIEELLELVHEKN
jgi:hypothetical protein